MSWHDVVSAGTAQLGIGLRRPLGPLILMYHGVGGGDGVELASFRDQLELLQERARIVSLRAGVGLLGEPEASQVAVLTFDDGYSDFAEIALPEIARRGLHATLFVPAGHVGGANEWDIGQAQERRILGGAALADLDPRHVEVGAHGTRHCRMRGLSPERLREETRDARTTLEDLCGRPVELFAYPYGQWDDFDAAAECAVEAAGFHAACSTRFGRGSSVEERFRLRRVGVLPGDDLRCFERKLEGAYDWMAVKETVGFRLRSGFHRGIS